MNYKTLPEKSARTHSFYSFTRKNIELTLPKGKLNISYIEEGSGKPLLLVHGLMTNAYSFRFITKELSKYYRVIVPDLPGAGKSDAPK